MSGRWLQVTLALVIVTATATLSSGQQMAAAFPALPSCPPVPLSLSPCIGYVFGVGSATLASCCSQLRGFLQAQAPCLCVASTLAPSPIGLFLGQAQAMIPNVCDLPNPCDGTLCMIFAQTPVVPGTVHQQLDKLAVSLVMLQKPPPVRAPRRRRQALRLRLQRLQQPPHRQLNRRRARRLLLIQTRQEHRRHPQKMLLPPQWRR